MDDLFNEDLQRFFMERSHHSEREVRFRVTVTADSGEVMTEVADSWEAAVHRLYLRNQGTPPDSAVPNPEATP